MKALLYLELRQFINAIKNTARSPKRLIPMLIMGAWVVSWCLQNVLLLSGDTPRLARDVHAISQIPTHWIEYGLFVFFSIGSVLTLYGAFSSGLMVFSISHIDFMFPTPISRKKVLLIKLLKDYAKYGLYVGFFFMLIGSPVFSALGVSIFPYGLISIAAVCGLLLLVINLAHTINIVFTFGYERLKQLGLIIKIGLVAVLGSVVGYAVYQYVTTGDCYASFAFAVNSPLINAVFAPARWTAELFLAPLKHMISEDWMHLEMLWGMVAGSFLLLFSRRENIYEPSLGISVKFAKRRLAMRSGDYSGVKIDEMREKGTKRIKGFALPPFGRGATAILWKNMLLKYRVSRGQLLFMVLLPLAIVFVVKRLVDDEEMLQNLPFMLLYIVYILSIIVQTEMRADLKQANVIKPMPIAAWKIILAQVTSAVFYLTAGIWTFAAALWLLVPESRGWQLDLCAFGAPSIAFATISVTIIPSILYPDVRDPAQNYLSGFIGFFLVSVAVLPAIALGAFTFMVLKASVLLTLLVITLANLVIGAAGVSIAGVTFQKFDPTGE